MSNFITDTLAKRRVRRQQKEAERAAALERRQREQNEHELVMASDRLLLNHMEECCIQRDEFKPAPDELNTDGIDIPELEAALKSIRSPRTGKKMTMIKVASDRLGLKIIRIYSHRAKCVGQRVCPI